MAVRPTSRVQRGRVDTCPRCMLGISRGDSVCDVWQGAFVVAVHPSCVRPTDTAAPRPPTPGLDTCIHCDSRADLFPEYNDLGQLCHATCDGWAVPAERLTAIVGRVSGAGAMGDRTPTAQRLPTSVNPSKIHRSAS